MGSWRHTLDVARRRSAVKASLAAGVVVLPVAAGLALGWAAVASALERPVYWPWVAGGVGLAVMGSAVVGFLRRPSVLAVASALDRHGGLHDAISSALQLSRKGSPTPLELRAIADADVAASGANAAGAIPIAWRRMGVAALLSAAMLTGSAFIPERWTVKAAQLAGLNVGGGPPKAEVQKALADAQAAEKLIQAVQPVVPPVASKPEGERASADAERKTARSDPLAELREQLEKGKVSPREATQQAATAVERAADRLDERAADAESAHELLRDRLALGQQELQQNADKPGAEPSELGKALREGDISKAADEAERLADAVEKLSPSERARLAEDLKKIAEDLKQARPSEASAGAKPDAVKPQGAGEVGDAGKQGAADNARERAGAPGEQKPQGGEKGAAQSEADQNARELAEKLDRAADELNKPTPARDDKRTDRETAGKAGQKQTQSSKSDSERQPKPESSGPSGEDKPSDATKPSSGEKSERGGAKPSPQDGTQAGDKASPGEKQQPDATTPDSEPQAGDGSPQGKKQQPNDAKPSQDGKSQAGEKPEQRGKPEQGNQRQQGDQTPREEKQQANEARPSPDGRTQSGDKPEQGGQRQDDKRSAEEKQPQAAKPSPEGKPTPEESRPSPDGKPQPNEKLNPAPDAKQPPDTAKQAQDGKPNPDDSKPAPDGKATQGDKAAPNGTPRPDASKPLQDGKPQSGDQPSPDGTPQSDSAKPLPDGAATSKPDSDGKAEAGRQRDPDEKPDQNGKPEQAATPGSEGDKSPTGGEQRRGGKQEGDGEPPAMEQLRDQLKKLAEKPREAKQNREDAQKLREQAQKMWDKATPEQRKEMEKIAREIAEKRSGEKGGLTQDQARGPGGAEKPEMPPFPGHAAGDRPTGDRGEGAGGQPAGDKPVAGRDDRRTTTQDIDARSKGAEKAPSRVIAEWLTNKPAPRTGELSSPAPTEVARAVEQAQRDAEQAVQERAVPSRLSPLIRKYFERLPQAVGAPAPTASRSPSPAPLSPTPTPAAPGTPANQP